MATSGSTSVKVTDYDTLKFSWSISSQSTTNNTSTVNWKLQLIATNYGYISSSASKSWSVTVNGTKYSGTNTVGISNNTTKTLASGTTTISHNSDGTKTFSYSFSQQFSITFSGVSIGTKSGSGSGTLTTIPRGSVLGTISAFTIGNAINIPITKYSSSFTDTLTISVGGTTVKTVSSITNGYDVSFTSTELGMIFAILSGKTNGTFTFKITTKSGSTTIGTSSKTATGTIPTGALGTISNFTLGDSISIPISKYYTSLTYSLTISLNDTTIKSVSEVINGYDVKLTSSELTKIYNKLPSATTGTFTFKLTTKSGNIVVGTSSKTATGTIPSSVKPTISSVTISEANTDVVPSSWGIYVKNKTKLKFVTSASAGSGSSISSIKVTINGSTYTGSTITTNLMNKSGSLTATITVTDKRNRSTSTTKTVTIVDYGDPYITTLNAFRCDENGNATDTGTYLYVSLKGGIYSCSGKNTPTYTIQYKKTSASEYTIHKFSVTATTIDTYVILSNIDGASSYSVMGVISDYFTSTNKSTPTILSAFRTVNYRAGGRGMGIGKIAEKDNLLDIGFATKFSGGIEPILLEPGTDLNNVKTCGWYGGYDVTNYDYGNCPIADGTFDLEVLYAGELKGDRKQILTRYAKSTSVTYERFYYNSAWGEWVCVSNFANTLLWSGTYYMTAGHTATLYEPISKQINGIVLVFSEYVDGAPQDTSFNCHFVPKRLVSRHSGVGHIISMSTSNLDYYCTKYLYISDDKIVGHANNNLTMTGNSGITCTNSRFVLRYVFGV